MIIIIIYLKCLLNTFLIIASVVGGEVRFFSCVCLQKDNHLAVTINQLYLDILLTRINGFERRVCVN